MSTELVPADPERLVEQAADPAQAVVLYLERAKVWLTEATQIEDVVEAKSRVEAIRVYVTQKELGKDAELAAAEIVRRAERRIGQLIREGQEEGTIRRHGYNQHTEEVHDVYTLQSPRDFFPNGNVEMTATYAMVDGVADDQFEQAIEEAKAEKNLSRANVVRKVQPEKVKPPERHEILRHTRHIDPNRIVGQTVITLDGAAMAVGLLNTDDLGRLDPQQIEGWVTSLSNSLRSLNRLAKQLKEMTRDQG